MQDLPSKRVHSNTVFPLDMLHKIIFKLQPPLSTSIVLLVRLLVVSIADIIRSSHNTSPQLRREVFRDNLITSAKETI